MASLEYHIRLKQAAGALAPDTFTMCIKNKPFEWLNTLTNEEKESIINGAREIAPELRIRFKEKQKGGKLTERKPKRRKQVENFRKKKES